MNKFFNRNTGVAGLVAGVPIGFWMYPDIIPNYSIRRYVKNYKRYISDKLYINTIEGYDLRQNAELLDGRLISGKDFNKIFNAPEDVFVTTTDDPWMHGGLPLVNGLNVSVRQITPEKYPYGADGIKFIRGGLKGFVADSSYVRRVHVPDNAYVYFRTKSYCRADRVILEPREKVSAEIRKKYNI